VSKFRASLVTALSVASVALLVATAAGPDWIEEVFAVAPDAGSGLAEALITGVFVALTMVSGLASVLSWRKVLTRARPRPTSDN
jgi:hypothetical protein